MQSATGELFSTDELRWEALANRDRQADGAFVYAVKTTGVYCRPACSSRLPSRHNVYFFQTCSEAEQAGFRPCKRCQPNTTSPRAEQVQLIAKICKKIEASEISLSLSELAAVAGLSQYHFQRLFKEIVGVTPKAYGIAQRQKRVRDGLQQGRSVTQTLYDAGFGTNSHFYEGAIDMLGMVPSQYKAGAADVEIQFAIERSFLGWVLVAATEKGICAIDFGDTPKALTEQLQSRFPNAQIRESDAIFSGWVAQVMALIETPDRGLDLPLDVQGTAFQQRVWKALQTIPPGTTVSYTEVAQQIDSPTAVRAVATACAANKLAVAIPCHRVVRSNGELSGYRWGVERKRALLDRESSPNNDRNPHALRLVE
ncbi:MAG: bifunctional DNA-binding transcriptional regulator/O6-methylguanine-DNA methyltransferase Ada [Drouetiella hepatica Uher 2000/2452]|jgi:AraC family transcriptional regulator of adaptative response/methylated-DNA-[protein]-cysteine methyltransferase|uniref:methylated-DNA--[protein]-cysteine S-methyltransferase n=1 Tax=Drouetiella hepatica Uher 2000/2452 TaxID=904376 RepID=A0A951UL14_9CYAN|nr:bifunctional DNA-binding transcriptional regulator/O6-methylguanine-DNA methyltransferase Ada [Drouetiella hepatica Uher 2000/2452]